MIRYLRGDNVVTVNLICALFMTFGVVLSNRVELRELGFYLILIFSTLGILNIFLAGLITQKDRHFGEAMVWTIFAGIYCSILAPTRQMAGIIFDAAFIMFFSIIIGGLVSNTFFYYKDRKKKEN